MKKKQKGVLFYETPCILLQAAATITIKCGVKCQLRKSNYSFVSEHVVKYLSVSPI